MKNKLMLIAALLMTLCIASSCAYLPIAGLDWPGQPGAEYGTSEAPSEDTVVISRADYERYRQLEQLADIMDLVEEYYYQDMDESKLLDGAASGMLQATNDPYTFYYNAEDYAALWEDDEGEYAGVGIQISASYITQICTISRVFKDGPAEKAGVRKGDILYKVEDLVVTADNLDEAVSIMRGTPGTTVHVSFLRGDQEMQYELERAQISVNRVASTMLADGIGYIHLYEFAGNCAKEFSSAVDELAADGVKGLMIDLRDNPGGWVNDAQSIADLFLDKGILCYMEHKDGSRIYYDTYDGKLDLPLVILLNENSASSSVFFIASVSRDARCSLRTSSRARSTSSPAMVSTSAP